MTQTDKLRQIYSLLDITQSIQKIISTTYKGQYWVKAEMNKLNYYPQTGHCYPDLVEKNDGKIIAQIRANIWKNDFLNINQRFLQVVKEPLKDGVKLLLYIKVTYDPVHGIALRILDIDPGFTIGDLEVEKLQTIQRLQAEVIFGENKKRPIPLLPKRIAVISVESSKGYSDFKEILSSNSWGYYFYTYLFSSLMQGEKAVETIIRQLERIRNLTSYFDVVAIIRGGGGDIGLSCYNNYELCKVIAQYPIPVLTGIGHSTNETVAEMVSHTNAITPTKLAEYLIQCFHDFTRPIQYAEKMLNEHSNSTLREQKAKIDTCIQQFRLLTSNKLQRYYHNISAFSRSVSNSSDYFLRIHNERLNSISRNIENLSPERVLKRGYSITKANGKVIMDSKKVKNGDIISTTLYKGEIISIVQTNNCDNE